MELVLSMLLVLASLWAQPVTALSCSVERITDEYVGKNKRNDSYTFGELKSIARIEVFELKNPDRHACPPRSYHDTNGDNVLTVYNRDDDGYTCKARFKVYGELEGCTAPAPSTAVAQAPLFLTQPSEPNVMYILDDSGSMQFELMPDSIILSSARYIFPRANGVYGGSDYTNRVPTVAAGSAYNARSRSPQVNKVYYDPGRTYAPWIKADGSAYPNADPSCALHHPERRSESYDAARCRNLTVLNSNYNGNQWVDCNSSGFCSISSDGKNFWPAKYFWHNGGSDWLWANYSAVEIRPTTPVYIGHGREARDDCADAENATCTYAEELQNFANWYTYYRSRINMARAGSGFAFYEQGAGLRVGFSAINQSEHRVDGHDSRTIVSGVRNFNGDSREHFYNLLYQRDIPAEGTPLRRALDDVGQYFQRRDNKGPWSATPGVDNGDDQLACRRNYAVLMTDGYWSSGDSNDANGDAKNNNDGTSSPSHSGPTGAAYTYTASSPFADDYSDTLADVAMYYWKRDLRGDLENVVAVTRDNPAFWQHMTTYGVGLGVYGTVEPSAAFAAVGTGEALSWPDPTVREGYKIDDLLHAAVNSRGGFFSAADPDTFAAELSAVLQNIADQSKSSASSIAANSTRLDCGTLIYQASFNSADWSGRLVAYRLRSDGQLGQAVWDSNDTVPSAPQRNIITGVGKQGEVSTSAEAFEVAKWTDLTDEQRAFLSDGGAESEGQDAIQWLRGDTRNAGLKYRERVAVLGDIVNSDPFFVGAENFGLGILPGAEGVSYNSFLKTKESRAPMIYVGANDGMLHGFHAETGKEMLAYIPLGVYPRLYSLTDSQYQHRYFVDGSPRAMDAYLNNVWKTVLVSSLAAGGRSVFALDVSSPDSFGKGNLLWEFATDEADTHQLGISLSQPVIARLKADNRWVAVFGNGYDSGDSVKLFIVDLATGALLKAIDTEQSGEGNSLGTPVPVDVDNDRVTDFVYAGDLAGNMWKFDLRGDNISAWSVAYTEVGDPAPLFRAVDGNGRGQPITTRPTVGRHPDGGYLVYFGTGRYFTTDDAVLPSSPQILDFYGVRDNGERITTKSSLVSQTVIFEGRGATQSGGSTAEPVRVVSNNSADAVPAAGWHLRLTPPDGRAEGERVVSVPLLRSGRVIFASIIPSESRCGFGGRSWLMEVDALNGGMIADPVLDTNSDGIIDDGDMVEVNGHFYSVSGVGSDEMIKTPGVIGAGKVEYKYTSGTSGTIGVITEDAGGLRYPGRQSWRQLQ